MASPHAIFVQRDAYVMGEYRANSTPAPMASARAAYKRNMGRTRVVPKSKIEAVSRMPMYKAGR